MLRMIVRSDRIVNELGDGDRTRVRDTPTLIGDMKRALNASHCHFYKLFEVEVIQTANCSVIKSMLDDNQCFRLVGFMVAVITTLATTGLTVLSSVN